MFGKRQRGAIGVLAAVTLLLVLICMALVVDTGRLYLEQRKLQRVADMAALESATQSGMCATQANADVQALAITSARRNGFPDDGRLVASLGDVVFDGSGQRRVFRAANSSWNDSVQVVASRTVPSSLVLNVASVFGAGTPTSVTLQAQAVARRQAMAALSAGSGLLRLDSSNSPLLNALLGGLLGTRLNLDLVTYQGIAGANVNLLALGEQLQLAGVDLDLGSVDSLLDADVSVAQLLQAAIDAADASQVAGVNLALLRSALASIKVPSANISLGQIISVIAPDSARNAALGADVNLLDLLMTTALVANKQHALAIPGLTLNVPGLTSLTVKLTVISPPTIAVGYPGKDATGQWRTRASSVQVALNVVADVDLLKLGLVNAHIDLGASVAQGYAALDSIACGGAQRTSQVNVKAQPGVAAVALNDLSVKLLGNGNAYLASVSVNTRKGDVALAAPGEQPLAFDIASPADLPSAVQRVQSPLGASLAAGIASLSRNLSLSVELNTQGLLCKAPLVGWLLCPLGKLLDGVVGGLVNSLGDLTSLLTQALASVLVSLGSQLIDPLLQLLGIQTGTLDVRIIDLRTPGAQLLI
ncbi:pilus assembly protein TadG-related protein [Pseudomonas citronellolis]|uniref:pilus assembly protein TadG-related protein n=1 Tax=Pseudomonas citronellolis TaxID=53408 RepID=UPI002D773D1C|nr:pilus assembly protein TadG-related protein [Pseudomonas citronellolis]WRT83553.1 pilus assembly protein TadG-related protein [Pseudomonas citronellolis]